MAGRFRVLELLGAGSVGDVFLVEHNVLGRRYALKLLKAQFLADANLMERFRREALVASRLEHPNIVYIADFGGAEDGRFYLAMEYIQGTNLSLVIEQVRPGVIALHRALAILKQLAGALGAAHDAGVVHRDLKPENIMLSQPPTGEEVVKVLDFGLAMIMVDSGAYKLTRRGEIFGTPMFMSPEQARGEALDSRTDIYSFGVVAFELFTGRAPFECDTLQQLIVANQKQIPPAPSQVRPSGNVPLPVELDRFVLSCLEKDRERRPATMREVTAGLEVSLKRARRTTRAYTAATPVVAAPSDTAEHPTLPPVGPPEPDDLNQTLPNPTSLEDAARVAVEDPWLWRQVARRTRSFARSVLTARDDAPELPGVLDELDDLNSRLQAAQSELVFPSARLEDLEQAHRERTARLRHAIIDLNLERSREVDQGVADRQRIRDLDYQIQALEERLATEYRDGKSQAAGVEQEVAELERRREELVAAKTALELRLLGGLRELLAAAATAEQHATHAELERLLRGVGD